jgi:RecJ-like exonuclease
MAEITATFENEEGEEQTVTFPAKMEVCDECDGEGFVLCEGMRGHAYSAEEFAESFDDEEAGEYFKRGGRYDQVCPCCKGKNVVPVVDQSVLTPEQKVLFAQWEESEDQKAAWDREDRATMRMESGCWD